MKVLSVSSKEGLDDDDDDDDDDACGELNSLEQEDSTHCHSYNSNTDGFAYLGYNC